MYAILKPKLEKVFVWGSFLIRLHTGLWAKLMQDKVKKLEN
jgi:hypothetical protein